MNVISFDIEEWAVAKANGYGNRGRYEEYDYYLNEILDALDQYDIKGSFFCTGMMATDFPYVLHLIHKRGHEIGCHSHRHLWMNRMTKTEAREDTRSAVDALEQCIGQKILSYRAPAFSIGEKNRWMFEVLAENGIKYDASIFPAVRDFGGFPKFGSKIPCIIEYSGIKLKEFPICPTKVFGKEFAYSGGGYFRFFPLSFVKDRMEKAEYTMCYFHIGDFLSEKSALKSKIEYEAYFKETGSLINRYMRYIKSNLGRKGAWDKVGQLISSERFVCIERADMIMDWSKASIIAI